MTYIPGSASNWTDDGPSVRPLDGPTEAVVIGVIGTPVAGELLRVVGDARIENGKLVLKDTGYNGTRIKWGTYEIFVDSAGIIRIKNGTPSSDTDGTIVGQQS